MTKFKRVTNNDVPPDPSLLAGIYQCKELNAHYTIKLKEDTLYLSRNKYDTPTAIRTLTRDTFVCSFGEIRFTIKDSTVKGFTLHTYRANHLKFQKKK